VNEVASPSAFNSSIFATEKSFCVFLETAAKNARKPPRISGLRVPAEGETGAEHP
jgi:hypothetical protein